MPNERVIRFTTTVLDVRAERPNPHNPIAGESLLRWLAARAGPDCHITEPEAEDWGWFATARCAGRTYMLGSSASDEVSESGAREWVLQIIKRRSFGERLLGRARMTDDDPCAALCKSLIDSEEGFADVSVDS